MQIQSSVFNHYAKVLLIFDGDLNPQIIHNILKLFEYSGFVNVAFAQKVNGRLVISYTQSSDTNIYFTAYLNQTLKFYPDKLSDMKQVPIYISIHQQYPKVQIKSGQVRSHMISLLGIVMDKMNASIRFEDVQDMNMIAKHWMTKKMDLTLNTALQMTANRNNAPTLKTYQEAGFCALIPSPPEILIFKFFFIEPFNKFVWLFLALTVTACMITWRMYQNRGTTDSQWFLFFGMIAMFFGQFLEFRHTKRVVLVILFQIIVVMMFVLSQGYQGAVTSFMIQPVLANRMKTVRELIISDLKIVTSELFAGLIQDSEEFQAIKSKMIVTQASLDKIFEQPFINEKVVLIVQCDIAEYLMDKLINYYILPQKILSYFEELEASFYNPYIEKFQHFMDRSFEAGLVEAWLTFAEQDQKNLKAENHDVVFLKLKDLERIFYVLIIGYSLSLFVFLLEIFFHDCIRNLEIQRYVQRLRNVMNKYGTAKRNEPKELKRKLPRRPKVRRVRVRPIDV